MYQAGLLGNLKLRKVKNEFTCNNKLQISINLYIYDIRKHVLHDFTYFQYHICA